MVLPDDTNTLEYIGELESTVDRLTTEILSLRSEIKNLKRRLLMYENPHTPPSKQLLAKRKDDDSIRGYFFVSFLSLYLYYTIFVLIRAADLTDKISVKDALLKFSRVYEIMDGKKSIMSEIPASSAKLNDQLGTNIFPKNCGVKVQRIQRRYKGEKVWLSYRKN